MDAKRKNKRISRIKKQGKTASSRNDQYLAVWILINLKWSARRIANLKLPSSHHTIENYFSKACDLIESGELDIIPCRKRDVEFIPIGTTTDVEYTNALIHQNPCGGGKRAKKHIYSSNYEHNGKEASEANS